MPRAPLRGARGEWFLEKESPNSDLDRTRKADNGSLPHATRAEAVVEK